MPLMKNVYTPSPSPSPPRSPLQQTFEGEEASEAHPLASDDEDIVRILEPEIEEEILMARIMEDVDDDPSIVPIVDSWNKILIVKNEKIYWEDLFQLDVADGEIMPKKHKPSKKKFHGSWNALTELKEQVLEIMAQGFIDIAHGFNLPKR